MFAGIAIELSTHCPKCRGPLPLNGASDSVLCDQCRNVLSTPPEFWNTVLADAMAEAIGMEMETGRTSSMFTKFGEFKLVYGRLDARCANAQCKEKFSPEQLSQGAQTGQLACVKCGTRAGVRAVPDWLRSMHPKAALLVGETMGATAPTVQPGSVRFHCYHCGGAMPLDGKERSVTCTYCHNPLMVPDDIWVRLHPVRTVERWWVVLAMDLSRAAGVLPGEVSDLCGIAVEASGKLVVAWHDDDHGAAGHPCRIALCDSDGVLLWKQSGVEFSTEARLLTSPADASIWLFDPEGGFARQLDPRNGQPVRTLQSGRKNSLDVGSAEHVVIDWDGSFLVLKDWEDSTDALRRFAPDGSRIPTWPGQKVYNDETDIERPEWPRLPAQPIRLPSSSLLHVGWDGCVWVVDRDGSHVAKYWRDGRLLGVMPLPPRMVQRVYGVVAMRDGTLSMVFEPVQKLGDREWPHVGKLLPDGRFGVVLGPYLDASAASIGTSPKFVAGMPDGALYIAGSGVDELRGFGADGRLVFVPAATRNQESGWIAEELAKARKGKQLTHDRGR